MVKYKLSASVLSKFVNALLVKAVTHKTVKLSQSLPSKSPAFKAGKGLKEQVNATKAKKTQKIIPKGYERDLRGLFFFVYLWYNAQRKGAL